MLRYPQTDVDHNCVGWRQTLDGAQAVPNPCEGCGQSAIYGVRRHWMCTGCYLLAWTAGLVVVRS